MSAEKLIEERLEIFKTALVKNINGVMSRMFEDITRDNRTENAAIGVEIASLKAEIASLKGEIAALKATAPPADAPRGDIISVNSAGAVILKPEIERALVGQVCKKLTAVVIPKITEKVMDQVRGDINENVIPMINNTLEYIGYATQDGQELMTEYRREVMGADDVKLLGDARLARNTFGHYRRAFMDDE